MRFHVVLLDDTTGLSGHARFIRFSHHPRDPLGQSNPLVRDCKSQGISQVFPRKEHGEGEYHHQQENGMKSMRDVLTSNLRKVAIGLKPKRGPTLFKA